MPYKYFSCIVPGCGNSSAINPQEAFFQLPKTMIILNEWVRNMNLPDLVHKAESTRRHYKVCRRHFDDSCFQTPEKTKLNRGVVPTIFNLESDLILPEEIEPFQEAIPACSHELSHTMQTVPGPLDNPVTAGPSDNPSDDEMPNIPLRSPDVNKGTVTPGRTSTKLVTGKRPYNILQLIDAKHIGDLSPRKRKYHRELVKAKHIITTMRRRGATCVKKLFHDPSDMHLT